MAYEKQTWEMGQVIGDTKLNHIEEGVEMANSNYEKTVWNTGDVITAEKLNKIEKGIENASTAVSIPKKDVNFFDYDGTILHSYTAAEALALTALPENPSHDGLTAQGWNWSLTDMKTQVSEIGACDIGQMYITDDGKTRIYVHFEKGRTSPYLGLGVNGTVDVDWGDGSEHDTLTGTSQAEVTNVQHVYAPGDYVIKLMVVSGSFTFFGTNNIPHILKKSTETSAINLSRVYLNAVQKIELGNGVTSIGSAAFNNCSSLASITIPSSVTSIGSFAFNYCYNLSSITIPKNVTSIDNYTFSGCSSLVSITIPSSVTSIGDYAFSNCYGLVSITIPSSVTSIGANAFSSCSSLASITIPSSVTSIGNSVFNSCSNLASITIPSSVTSIGSSMFGNCSSLASITIQSGVTSIGDYAFNYCYGLTNITIPSSVMRIGNSTFFGCQGMAEYHFQSTTPPALSSNVFKNIPSDCIIYVPRGSLEVYQTASTNWSTYASKMQEEPE